METLLSSDSLLNSRRWLQFSRKTDRISIPNGIGIEYQDLEEQLDGIINDKIESLETEGILNPYSRSSKLPPIHLNINIQTRPVMRVPNLRFFKRIIGPLWLTGYDNHKEGGIATNRADPLVFPNFAQVPFFPTFGTLSKISQNINQRI